MNSSIVSSSGSSGLGSSPSRGHCAVFLGKTLYSHNAGEVSVQGTRSCNCPGFQCHAVQNQNLSLDKVQNLEKERRPI